MQTLSNTERLITWVAAGMMLIYITMEGVSFPLIQSANAIPFCSGFLVLTPMFFPQRMQMLFIVLHLQFQPSFCLPIIKKRKNSQTVCAHNEPAEKPPISDGRERHQKQFQYCLNFLSVLVSKSRPLPSGKKRILLPIFLLLQELLTVFQQL